MSCTTRSAMLKTRKNSEVERETRTSSKRKKLNSSLCDSSQGNKNLKTNENKGKTDQFQKENFESMQASPTTSTPAKCNQFSRTILDFSCLGSHSRTPLPILNWADSDDFWTFLKETDKKYPVCGQYMSQHPSLQPKMRTILLDWLIEVCEVYRLHRETFHLAVGYVDRYLKVKKDIHKSTLQLVGVTALFIAAKLEEIYPPKVAEFAYVTDGACTEDEIQIEELVMLEVLNWKLTPVTINTWIRIYLQLESYKQDEKAALFLTPAFSGKDLVQSAKLADLCVLDMESIDFPNRILAAVAVHYTVSTDIVKITDIAWSELYPCIQWMRPFAEAVHEQGLVEVRLFDKIPPEDCANIQTHTTNKALMADVAIRKSKYSQISSLTRCSPPSPTFGVLTPPSSSKKGKMNR